MIAAICLLAVFEVAAAVILCSRQEKMQRVVDNYSENRNLDREWLRSEKSRVVSYLENWKKEAFDELEKKLYDLKESFSEGSESEVKEFRDSLAGDVLRLKKKVLKLVDEAEMKVNDTCGDFKILKIFLKSNTCRDNFDFIQKVQECFYRAGVKRVEVIEDEEADENGDAFKVKYESQTPYYFHINYDFDEEIMKFGVFEVGKEADEKRFQEMEFEET